MATEKAKTKRPSKATATKAVDAKVAAVVVAPAAPVAAPAPKTSPVAAVAPSTEARKTHGFRRKMIGRVTSNKMDKTVTVEVIRNSRDTVYKKYVRQRERYKAHDPENAYKIGDRVEIQEHRPISREKRWLVIRLVSRSVEE